jgi:hypothetical protein
MLPYPLSRYEAPAIRRNQTGTWPAADNEIGLRLKFMAGVKWMRQNQDEKMKRQSDSAGIYACDSA